MQNSKDNDETDVFEHVIYMGSNGKLFQRQKIDLLFEAGYIDNQRFFVPHEHADTLDMNNKGNTANLSMNSEQERQNESEDFLQGLPFDTIPNGSERSIGESLQVDNTEIIRVNVSGSEPRLENQYLTDCSCATDASFRDVTDIRACKDEGSEARAGAVDSLSSENYKTPEQELQISTDRMLVLASDGYFKEAKVDLLKDVGYTGKYCGLSNAIQNNNFHPTKEAQEANCDTENITQIEDIDLGIEVHEQKSRNDTALADNFNLLQKFAVMDSLPFEKKTSSCDIDRESSDTTRFTNAKITVKSTDDYKSECHVDPQADSVQVSKDCDGSLDNAGQFNCLPCELTQKIFGFLTLNELCTTVAPVCRKWRDYAYDPVHWKELTLGADSQVTKYQLAQLILKSPRLRKLNISGKFELAGDEVLYISRSCPQLRELDLGFVVTINEECISNIAHNCRNLEKLNVEGCVLVDDICMKLICKEHCLENLQSLNVSHCFHLSDASLRMLGERKTKLCSLNIDGISWITDDALADFCRTRGSALRHLWLDGAEISNRGVESLAENCVSLQLLSFSFAELLTDAALTHIKKLITLESLTLRKGQDFSDHQLQELFKDKSLQNLRRLDLSECVKLTDSGISSIMECCGAELTHLSLSWCWFIYDAGVESIVNTCRQLRHLDLTGLDKIRGTSFSLIPTKMPNLTFLDLKQCNKIVDDIIYEVIEQRQSKLEVIDYYGNEFEKPR